MAISKEWLDTVGGVKVERLTGVKRSGASSDQSKPARAVLHTTEGGWDGSMAVFRSTGTPTFMVGRDNRNVLRVAQFMPMGEMALTLKNASGGVETNRWCLVQIELVGFSQRTFGWPLGVDRKPMDEAVKRTLADLVDQCSAACGIPLKRAGDGTRSVANWSGNTGWFGHAEVPENDHWDPGNFDWADLFKRARPPVVRVRYEIRQGQKILFASKPVRQGPLREQRRLLGFLTFRVVALAKILRTKGPVSLRRVEVK